MIGWKLTVEEDLVWDVCSYMLLHSEIYAPYIKQDRRTTLSHSAWFSSCYSTENITSIGILVPDPVCDI